MALRTDPPAAAVSSGTRLHALDALRAGALLLGIVLHSLLPFVPELPWLVTDSQTSWWAAVPVYVIHLFRMALFMLLAGYFGRLVVHRRGAGSYLKDRVVRILLPLIVFWPIAVLSLGILVMVNAEVNDRPLPAPPPGTPAPAGPLAAINPGQLWFLWVLMQCVVIILAGRAVLLAVLGPRRSAELAGLLGRLLTSPAGVLLAAGPYAAALLLQGSVVGGIIAPASLLPELPALLAYLGAFVVGWLLHACPDSLTRLARTWPVHLGLAVALSAVGFLQSGTATGVPVAAAVMALAGWAWVYGLLGLCVRHLRSERPWIRYLADASYWMYLLHLPLLVAMEIPLVPLAWPIMIKVVLTWVVVGAVLLISYHLLVRSTPVGRWLNGRRYPFRLPSRARSSTTG